MRYPEIYTGAWKQCYRCRKPTPIELMVGRQDVVHVTTLKNIVRITFGSYRHYGIVDICPACDAQQVAWEERRQKQTGLAIAGGSVALFGWHYITLIDCVAGLTVAGITVLSLYWGKLWQNRRSKRNQVPTST